MGEFIWWLFEVSIIPLSTTLLIYIWYSIHFVIDMENKYKAFHPTDDDFQIQVLSNGHFYMGCPADDKRLELLREICQESSYLRGYHAYWEGLNYNEVSTAQSKGWQDAKREVEGLVR